MPKSSTALSRATLKKEEALAELRRLQTDALTRTLIPIAEVRQCWSQACASFRDRAMALPDRIAQQGANRTEDELRRLVDAEVRDLLETVARGTL